MRRYAEELLQEEKELRDLVQQVAEGHKNSKAAKEKLHEFKQSIGRPARLTPLVMQSLFNDFLPILISFVPISQ